MRKIHFPFFITLLFFAACGNNKEEQSSSKKTVTIDPNYDYLISMDGIGVVKLDMSQAELEKLLNKKIPLTNPTDTISGSWQDSATVNYKDIVLKIDFQRTYTEQDTFYMRVIAIETSSPLAKTSAGLSIGSDLSTIVDAYENNPIALGPDFTTNKTKYLIAVRDEVVNSREIDFYLVNKKVVAIDVVIHFSDSE